MSKEIKPSRVTGDVLSLDYKNTASFFERRGSAQDAHALTATMYQAPELAARRDEAEKATVLPFLNPQADDRVLDIGCGTGRWAESLLPTVAAYLGLDFSESLLVMARKRIPDATFQAVNVAHLRADELSLPAPFSLIICSGILAYINDADMTHLFAELGKVAGDHCRIYLREPMAKQERLTLDGFWSEELGAHYSAIYRTREEYVELLRELNGFCIQAEGEPFPGVLQNRAETEQRYFLIAR